MLTTAQTSRLHDDLFPHVNYLLRLRKRMEELRLQADPLYPVICRAYDAAWQLMREAHSRSMETTPPRTGTCRLCGARHSAIDGHSLRSRFYQTRFRTAHGREPTSADTVAHLPPDLQLRWRKIIESMGQEWSLTDSPVAEPYRVTR
jgi:hypothetical protein